MNSMSLVCALTFLFQESSFLIGDHLQRSSYTSFRAVYDALARYGRPDDLVVITKCDENRSDFVTN